MGHIKIRRRGKLIAINILTPLPGCDTTGQDSAGQEQNGTERNEWVRQRALAFPCNYCNLFDFRTHCPPHMPLATRHLPLAT